MLSVVTLISPEGTNFLDRLTEEIPTVADDAATAIVEQIGFYRLTPHPLFDEVHGVCLRSHLKLIQLWRERRDADEREIARLVEMGLPPLESAITLEDVLHAYRLATEILWVHSAAWPSPIPMSA